MSLANPYRSPETLAAEASEVPQPVYATRMRAARAGAWRGARLGFWTLLIIFGAIWLLGFAMAAFNPSFRREVMYGAGGIGGMTVAEIAFNLVKSLFFTLVFAVLYGSLPGGLIMGAIAAMRWRHPSDSENSTTLVT